MTHDKIEQAALLGRYDARIHALPSDAVEEREEVARVCKLLRHDLAAVYPLIHQLPEELRERLWTAALNDGGSAAHATWAFRIVKFHELVLPLLQSAYEAGLNARAEDQSP